MSSRKGKINDARERGESGTAEGVGSSKQVEVLAVGTSMDSSFIEIGKTKCLSTGAGTWVADFGTLKILTQILNNV